MADSIKGLPELLAAFDKLAPQIKAASLRGLTRGTMIVHNDAVRNAPRSPTQKQKNSQRKTKRNTKRSKKATATTRAKPGGLERSIGQDVNDARCEGTVFVPINSEAGRYAVRIHDEKGTKWQYRGKGTEKKGGRADEKFIERAVIDDEPKVGHVIEIELKKVEL